MIGTLASKKHAVGVRDDVQLSGVVAMSIHRDGKPVE